MNKHQNIILVSVCIIALVVGFLGSALYDKLTSTVYSVSLVNGCTRQPNGQVINTGDAGTAVDVRVANKDTSAFTAFALSRGICVDKQ